MTKPLHQIMQKEMTRQEFLTTLGFGIAAIMGFSTIIHLLTGKSIGSHGVSRQQPMGYGSSSYGGSTER